MTYSHVLFFGDSYMKCYVDSNGPRLLCDTLGAEPVTIVRSGSSHEYVLRRIYDAVLNKPRCLIVWGLTHPFRTEHPVNNRWLTLNYDHIKSDDHETCTVDPVIVDSLVAYNSNLIENFNLYMQWTLQQIRFVGSWLRSQGHDYLIYNQCCTDYAKINTKTWPIIDETRLDRRCYRIFDWYMNQYLHDKGVGVRDIDRLYFESDFNLSMHPKEGTLLAKTINDFILEQIA